MKVVRVRRGHSPNCSSAGFVVGTALLSAVAGAAVINAFAAKMARYGRARKEGGGALLQVEGGLVDPERLSVAQGLRTTAWVGGLVGIGCSVAGQAVLARFGWWTQVIPISLLVMAVAFYLAGLRFRVLTPQGLAALRGQRDK